MTINGHHRRRLESWKEISVYLGRGERTLQRWERERSLTVHRTPGGGRARVYAWVDELDAWLGHHDEGLPADGSASPDEAVASTEGPDSADHPDSTGTSDIPTGYPRRPSWRWLLAILAVAILAGAGVYLLSDFGTSSRPVDHLVADGRVLRAYDLSGDQVWEKTFPYPLGTNESLERKRSQLNYNWRTKLMDLVDLDGDGRQEVLVVTIPEDAGPSTSAMLYCLTGRGREKWRYRPGEVLTFGRTRFGPGWRIPFFLVVDLDRDGLREIVVVAHHFKAYPAKVAVLESDGRLRGDYINSGRIVDVVALDLDDDGRQELLCGGTNYGYGKGAFFALAPDHLGGASPQPDTPACRLSGRPKDRQCCYLLFPVDPVSAVASGAGMISCIEVMSGGLVVMEIPFWSEQVPTVFKPQVLFYLNRKMVLVRRSFSSDYHLVYDDFFDAGRLKVPFRQNLVDDLGPILYWNGHAYSPTPALKTFGPSAPSGASPSGP